MDHTQTADAATPCNARNLAEALAGVLIPNRGDAQVLAPAGLIYTGITGKIRLQRPSLPVVDLGTTRDNCDTIVRAYRAATEDAA